MRGVRRLGLEVVAVVVGIVLFVIPFVFIFLTAVKTVDQSLDLTFSWPTSWPIVQNLKDVFSARDHMLVTAFKNSIILTVVSVAVLVVLCAMVGFVIQRRPGPRSWPGPSPRPSRPAAPPRSPIARRGWRPLAC